MLKFSLVNNKVFCDVKWNVNFNKGYEMLWSYNNNCK